MSAKSEDDAFTLTSYNIRKAIGRDGKRSPERIVEVLKSAAADIVILQESDFRFKGRRAIFSAPELFDETGLAVIEWPQTIRDLAGMGTCCWYAHASMCCQYTQFPFQDWSRVALLPLS